jgi:hypothetical protein
MEDSLALIIAQDTVARTEFCGRVCNQTFVFDPTVKHFAGLT